MSVQPNYEDANLILRLYDLRREERMRAARKWFVDQCKPKTLEEWQGLCPPGSDTNASYRMVTTYWDMACSFVTNGILNPELFIQNNLEHLLVYERVRGILPEWRKTYKSPLALRNLEQVAGMAADWLDRQVPGTFQLFQERFKP